MKPSKHRALAVAALVVTLYQPPAQALFGVGDLSFDPTVYAELVSLYDQGKEIFDNAKKQLSSLADIQKTINEAGHGPIDKVGSIALCNPRYASRILADPKNRKVTAFMPLAIGVYEDGKGQVYVSQLDVGLMGMMFGGTIAEVMGVAGKDLSAVIATAVGK